MGKMSRKRISLVFAGTLFVFAIAPDSSILGELARDLLWDGDEAGVLGAVAMIWFSFHAITAFKQSQFYGTNRRRILVVISAVLVVSAAAAGGYQLHLDHEKEKLKKYLAEQDARWKAEKKARDAKIQSEKRATAAKIRSCEESKEQTSISEFCKRHQHQKFLREEEYKKYESERNRGYNLKPAWESFLLQSKGEQWTIVVRSTDYGDHVCFRPAAFFKKISSLFKGSLYSAGFPKDRLHPAALAVIDQIADKFIAHLNVNKVLATGKKYERKGKDNVQAWKRKYVEEAIQVTWRYGDLKHMSYLNRGKCGTSPSYLYRENRFNRVIPR